MDSRLELRQVAFAVWSLLQAEAAVEAEELRRLIKEKAARQGLSLQLQYKTLLQQDAQVQRYACGAGYPSPCFGFLLAHSFVHCVLAIARIGWLHRGLPYSEILFHRRPLQRSGRWSTLPPPGRMQRTPQL